MWYLGAGQFPTYPNESNGAPYRAKKSARCSDWVFFCFRIFFVRQKKYQYFSVLFTQRKIQNWKKKGLDDCLIFFFLLLDKSECCYQCRRHDKRFGTAAFNWTLEMFHQRPKKEMSNSGCWYPAGGSREQLKIMWAFQNKSTAVAESFAYQLHYTLKKD